MKKLPIKQVKKVFPIRMSDVERKLVERASKVIGVNTTSFVRESAIIAAGNIIFKKSTFLDEF